MTTPTAKPADNNSALPESVKCLECGAKISLAKDVALNEIIICPDCAAEFEVTKLQPFTLAAAPLEEEDWGE